MLELRDAQVVRQRWDLTCGAAAVATVLTYQLGRPVTEREVAAAMLRRTTPSLVRSRLGFSLLDLKIYAATQGLAAAAFDGMDIDDLDRLAPVIVPIRPHGFRHFVVYRGRAGDQVLIADPAFGNRSMRTDAFRVLWAGGIGFVVFDPARPHPPNRLAPSSQLTLAPAAAALRSEIFAERPVMPPGAR
ncbi:MAG TPA: cysteine peptidase family C39 domain-containing protein [Caulobacteraceae bacterium]|nr:cysteine peptidase family C39 domain-containing protein [Caulobacteraceae bacterium]